MSQIHIHNGNANSALSSGNKKKAAEELANRKKVRCSTVALLSPRKLTMLLRPHPSSSKHSCWSFDKRSRTPTSHHQPITMPQCPTRRRYRQNGGVVKGDGTMLLTMPHVCTSRQVINESIPAGVMAVTVVGMMKITAPDNSAKPSVYVKVDIGYPHDEPEVAKSRTLWQLNHWTRAAVRATALTRHVAPTLACLLAPHSVCHPGQGQWGFQLDGPLGHQPRALIRTHNHHRNTI